jgi:hypothetical protein
MELKSTATFKDIDIDALVETTSFDDFMSNLFRGKQTQNTRKQQSEFDKIMSELQSDETPQQEVKLDFGEV